MECLRPFRNHCKMLSARYLGGILITLSYREDTKFYNDKNSNNNDQNADSKLED